MMMLVPGRDRNTLTHITEHSKLAQYKDRYFSAFSHPISGPKNVSKMYPRYLRPANKLAGVLNLDVIY